MAKILSFLKPESQRDQLLSRLKKAIVRTESGEFDYGAIILTGDTGFITMFPEMSAFEITHLIGILERVKHDLLEEAEKL